MQFEWDAEKAAANARKHRVIFEEGETVFRDPLSLTFPDPDHWPANIGPSRLATPPVDVS
jgi:uncharacterized DUF497 family protein